MASGEPNYCDPNDAAYEPALCAAWRRDNAGAPPPAAAGAGPFKGFTVKKGTFTVPENIYQWISEAAEQTNVPPEILAAVLYEHTKWAGVDPEVVADVADGLRGAFDDMGGNEQVQTGAGDELTSGVAPDWYTAAAAYMHPGMALNTATGQGYIKQLRTALAQKIDLAPEKTPPAGRHKTASFPGVASRTVGGTASTTGQNAITNIDDAYSLIESYFGREPTSNAEAQALVGMSIGSAQAKLRADPEGQFWRENGTAIKKARSWVDDAYLRYGLAAPSNTEIKSILDKNMSPQMLEDHIRSTPHAGSTLGQFSDVRAMAGKRAVEFTGRPPDDGEIAFMLANGITTDDQVSAFYEQMKQRKDTGDPSFAWVSDPDTWRSTQQQIQSLYQRAGLTGKVDPHLVNQALTNKWSQADIQRTIDNMPAPGFGPGADGGQVTVGQINRLRPIAQSMKDDLPTLHQGEALTNDELKMFLGMSPDDIRAYYASLPARASKKVGQTPADASTAATPAAPPPQAPKPPADKPAPSSTAQKPTMPPKSREPQDARITA